MAFGPDISVHRVDSPDAQVQAILLAPFRRSDAAPHFPFPEDDPALEFLGLATPLTLREEKPDAFMALRTAGTHTLAWGIWEDRNFAGCVDFRLLEGTLPSLNVVLTPASRGRGIGTMATAAATEAMFDPELATYYVGEADAVETMIHPDNIRSRAMCTKLGFMAMGALAKVDKFSQKRWLHYKLENPEAANSPTVSPAVQQALLVRQKTMEQFEVKLG